MKYLIYTYKRSFVVVFALIISCLARAEQHNAPLPDDSVEVSLLTCSPHDVVYSLYGHTALRYHDLRTGEDWTFNYGVFNFNKPFFVLRFLFGLTDYELGVVPFRVFRAEYSRYGCAVTEQVLNLTPEEKLRLRMALEENYKEENRVYRYNFIFDNCTTRSRDVVERNMGGEKVKYASQMPEVPLEEDRNTYRKLLHSLTQGHPWAEFGNDLCLGLRADLRISWREKQFLPLELMADVEGGRIIGGGGVRPLVKTTRYALEPGVQFVNQGFPLTPMQCFCLLLALSVAVTVVEVRRRKTFVLFDALLMTVVGVAGVLIGLLFFSEHPTTSTNLQIFLLCPATLFFIPSVVRRKSATYWKFSLIMLILFFLGAFWQDYAEGMEILALCLLLRVCVNLYLAAQGKNGKSKRQIK